MEKIEYTKIKDYNIPNLAMEKEKIPNGKYARMRLKFLRENKKAYYSILLMDKSLNEELMRVQEQATEMINKIIEKLVKQEGITEEMKARDPMEWTGVMNVRQLGV